MGFRQSVNDWLSVVIKILVIGVIVIGVLWFGLSIWGNIANSNDQPEAPKESKAAYIVTLRATGQEFYTNKLSDLGNGKYELSGYYELVKNKWIYRNMDVILDKYYFGDITVRKR